MGTGTQATTGIIAECRRFSLSSNSIPRSSARSSTRSGSTLTRRSVWTHFPSGDDPLSVPEIHLEVKGVANSLVRFFLTANEHKATLVDANWRLVVVTDALGGPGWCELDGPTAVSYAEPALFQVRIPDEALAD